MDNGNLQYNFQSLCGIRLDGTPASSRALIYGLNTRFYQGTPLKLAGWKKLLNGQTDIIRGMFATVIQDFTRLYLFRNSGLSSVDIQADGTISPEVSLTPLDWSPPIPGTPDFVFSADMITVGTIVDGALTKESLLFVVGIPNSEVVEQTTESPVYYINTTLGTIFQPLNQYCSGGLIVYEPYLILFGNNGIMRYSLNSGGITDPLQFPVANFLIVSNRKLLAARNYRNAIIFWTKPRPHQVIIDFSTEEPTFTVLTTALVGSCLSPQGIVDGDKNSFFWVGNRQFYYFNGAVSKLANSQNRKHFYDNLNLKYPGKVWGIYNENYNEVWWFAPQGTSTECNMAYFASLDEKVSEGEVAWSNTPLPRSCGVANTILDQPLYASSTPVTNTITGLYALWMHEYGVDVEEEGKLFPLKASYQTRYLVSTDINPSINATLKIMNIEKDFVQSGDMTLEIYSYGFADAEPTISAPFIFSPSTTQLSPTVSGRYISFKYTSNSIGGDFHQGKNNLSVVFSSILPARKNPV